MRIILPALIVILLISCNSNPPRPITENEILIVVDPSVRTGIENLTLDFKKSLFSQDATSRVIPKLIEKTSWEVLQGFKSGDLDPDFLIIAGASFPRVLNLFSRNLSSKIDSCAPLGSLPLLFATRTPVTLENLPESFTFTAESPQKSSDGFYALNQKIHINRFLDIHTSPASLFSSDGLFTTERKFEALKKRLPQIQKIFPEIIKDGTAMEFSICRTTGGIRSKDRVIASGKFSSFLEQKLNTVTPEFFNLTDNKSQSSLEDDFILSTFNSFTPQEKSFHFLIDASGSMFEERRYSQVLDIARVIENKRIPSDKSTLSHFSSEFQTVSLKEKSLSAELSKIIPKGVFLTEDALKTFFASIILPSQTETSKKDLVIISDGLGIKNLNSILPIFEQTSKIKNFHLFLVILNNEKLAEYLPLEKIPSVTVIGYEDALNVFRGLD